MTVPNTTCPSCNVLVGDEDEVCAQCGEPVAPFRPVSRTPLILPGSPALSADDTSTGTPVVRAVGASVFGLALLGTVVVVMTREPAPRKDDASPLATFSSATSDGVADATDDTPASSSTDLRTDNLVAAVTARSAPPRTIAPSVAAATPTRARDTTPAPVAPRPSTTASEQIVQEAPTLLGAAPSSVVAAAPSTPAPTPVLRMVPLVSKSLHPGEIVRLRGTIEDLSTGRALLTGIRFSSADPRIARVDSRTGEVTGVSAGRVRIVADGGAAGRQAVDLAVIAEPKPVAPVSVATVAAAPRTSPATPPQNPPQRVSPPAVPQVASNTPPSPTIPSSTAPSRVVSTSAPPAVRAESAAARSVPVRPVARPNMAAIATSAGGVAPAPFRDVERPDAGDTRIAAERIAADVRGGGRRNAELAQFFADGASHKVSIAGAPATVGESASGVRVTFELRISKYDAAGRPITRFVPVQMDVVKREDGVNTSSVALGALRRP